jgi:hypothetical protein
LLSPIEQEKMTVLKKAGIVVAAAAAGLLAVSPLAFASDNDQSGIENINGITSQAPTQTCDNHVGYQDGALGFLGSAKNKQVNSGDCKQKNSSDN